MDVDDSPVTVAPTRSYERSDWASAFVNVEKELTDVELIPASGTVPTELNGTFYRNGPGRMERDGHRVHHPFDGDGMIAAMRFEGGRVQLSNRYVRTEGWLAEEKAGKVLYRGVFGSQKPGGRLANAFDLRLKNIANTNVVRLGDQLLALWEAAEPHALDPLSLETRGLSRLDGVLKKGEAFSAHPRFDPGHHGRPCMVTFGVKTGPRSTIRLMEFATDGSDAGTLLHDRSDSFPGFAFLHDFAITPNWAVFLQNAIAFNPLPFVTGEKGAAQCLTSQPGGKGRFWLIPAIPGLLPASVPASSMLRMALCFTTSMPLKRVMRWWSRASSMTIFLPSVRMMTSLRWISRRCLKESSIAADWISAGNRCRPNASVNAPVSSPWSTLSVKA